MRLLTLARDLSRRKARERESLFVAEGVRTVEELLRSSIEVAGVLVAPQLASVAGGRGDVLLQGIRASGYSIQEVSDREFASAAGTESPQGVLAIGRIPKRGLADFAGADPLRLVVLDAVQDPGNVGTIIRTAAALGAAGTVALPGTVDVWNAKVVRSSMGAIFTHSAVSASNEALLAFLRDERIPLWISDMDGDLIGREEGAPGRLAMAVGNEGAGISTALREAAARVVSIPMARPVESLNVAVATGILLHTLRP